MKQADRSFPCSDCCSQRGPAGKSPAFVEKEVLSQKTGPHFVVGLADLWPSADLAMWLVRRLKADYNCFECQIRTFLKSAEKSQENSVVGSLCLLQYCETKWPVAGVKKWLLGFQACCFEWNKEETAACLAGLYWFAMQTWMLERGRVLLAALENQVTLEPTGSEENYGTRWSVVTQTAQDLGSEVRKQQADSEIAWAAVLDSLESYYFAVEKLTGSVAPDQPLGFGLD